MYTTALYIFILMYSKSQTFVHKCMGERVYTVIKIDT